MPSAPAGRDPQQGQQQLAARLARLAQDVATGVSALARAFRERVRPRVGQRVGALRGRSPGGSWGQGSGGAWWRGRKVWIGFGLAVALIVAGWFLTLGPVSPGNTDMVELYVAPGQSTLHIDAQLSSLGLVRRPGLFRLWVRATGSAGKLKAGEYQLTKGMSVPQIAAKLTRGQVKLYPVTIPEGYNITQIRDLLVAKGFADAERFDQALATLATNGTLTAELQPEQPNLVKRPLEGFLFPDTYMLYRGITETEILRSMVGRLKSSFTQEMRVKAAELGMSINQVLALASVIEKEARRAEERTIISGVFHNRLRVKMALQSCATVRYVMKDPNGPIREQEMAINDVYNTYMYPGLPPGPICSPGLASIVAALNPDKVDYFYFVAKLDGSHAFSRTLAEHEANRRKYLGY